MAIAFRSVGTRLKTDISGTGSPQNVGMPAGHTTNDLLMLVVQADDNTGPSTPSGWSLLGHATAGTSSSSLPRPKTWIFTRLDTGALGSSVSVTFNTSNFPKGNPLVLACILAWSGCDTSAPVGEFSFSGSTSNAATQAHPQLTTTAPLDWLVTIRGQEKNGGATFTCSVGTDAERLDDSDSQEMSLAVYDSNTGLSTGLQTQRSTTASGAGDYGDTMISIALRAAGVGGNIVALAQTAFATGTANDAAAPHVSGPWDACGTLPSYTFAIDWDGDGSLETAGSILTVNPYFLTDLSNWTATGSAIERSGDLESSTSLWTAKVTPDGVSASGGIGYSPHTSVGSVVAGQSYVAQCWVYSPLGWSDLRATVDWYDSSDSFLSTTLGSATVVPAGVWTLLRQTLTAPASSSRSRVRMRFGGTPPSSNITYVWGLFLADPAASGVYMAPAPGEYTTVDILSGGVSISYGRDQSRQLSPSRIGSSGYSVNNTTRKYSPEYAASPLAGDLDPAREMKGVALFNGVEYPLAFGRVDDYNVHADRGNRTVDFTFADGLKLLDGIPLSTPVLFSQRTGDLINYILDQVGWTGGRDIDPGASIIPFWWGQNTNALPAIQDLVKSEGPPAIAYVGPDNTFIFRDRHHRILRAPSINVQATFAAKMVDCAAPAVTGLHFTEPFEYAHGWRDIVNSVSFDVAERAVDPLLSAIWTSTDVYNLSNGESRVITISSSDPFVNAVAPVAGTDYTAAGVGVLQTSLSQTSGASTSITLLAVGGGVVVTGLQLRAQAIPVVRTTTVSQQDTGSISVHGEKDYPDSAPWAGVQDALAITSMILLHYAQRRPTVQLRIVAQDGEHYFQILERVISDRIHITNGEMGLDDDFFIENISHQIDRMNAPGRPPVHAVIFGCEKEIFVSSNPFRFDVRGSGFDQGVFDPIGSDSPDTVFIFDDPDSGMFDIGLFGT